MILKTLKYGFLLSIICIPFGCGEQESDSADSVLSQLAPFNLDFVVMYRSEDPEMALRPAGLKRVPYNVASWRSKPGSSGDLKQVDRDASVQGDGFDDRILNQAATARTANYFNAGDLFRISPTRIEPTEEGFTVTFPEHELFRLSANIKFKGEKYPLINYRIQAKAHGFYSVGYLGAPQFALQDVDEIWQPLIWQELRIPEQPFLTLAYRTTLPTSMVRQGQRAFAVLAHPKELPFQPLPLASNSRFGVAVRADESSVKPMIFAPVLGGAESEMGQHEDFSFSFYAVQENATELTQVYERLSREIYGFRDYRSNTIASLNTAFENIIEYSMSEYAQWIEKLKGSSYSTDVPGAVKNVSSLNALSLALATDNKAMFEERAYPLMEYMLSREKFLFSLDPEQKIQHPSRALKGPAAPVSELSTLYSVLHGSNKFLLQMAEDEYNSSRVRNLDHASAGDTWQNALALYRATERDEYLQKAISGADRYLEQRVEIAQTEFDEGSFFWPKFTPSFVDLYQLYEITGSKKYLDAAQLAARRYTMFTWMAPKIPNEDIVVNEGGEAPIYWYLKSKGHQKMYAEEEAVPAWRLSEIGLTPESSGTSSGHRAIFMANYAPWLLRIGHHADDPFLMQVAKASVIGRYRNFPGYHINTARTTIYENADYPLRGHKELSVNSFHYNHILPMASLLLDYLVSDVYARSGGEIDFPSEFIEGYAYLQNKFYGHKPGSIYGENGVNLWMPNGLLEIDNLELNYISAYRDHSLYLAFTNQSDKSVMSSVKLNPELVRLGDNVVVNQIFGQGEKRPVNLQGNILKVETAENGLTVLRLDGVYPNVQLEKETASKGIGEAAHSYREIEFGDARAMLFNLGQFGRRAYIYLREDDSDFREVSINYSDANGEEKRVVDTKYPFEFTVPLSANQADLDFHLSGIGVGGERSKSRNISLPVKN